MFVFVYDWLIVKSILFFSLLFVLLYFSHLNDCCLVLCFENHNHNDSHSYEKAKADLATALKVLEDHLQKKTFLVGNRVTLADIVVASTLLYPFKLVADKAYVAPFPKVMQWFEACVSQPEFQQVIGQVALCKKEMTAPGQQ